MDVDMKNKELTCSAKDLEQINDEGCVLNFVDKTINLGDDDEEELFNEEDEDPALDKKAKEDRLRKEFISLALNTTRDPMKVSSECRLKRLLEEQEDIGGDEYARNASRAIDHVKIHKKYDRLGKYDDLLANKENKFIEISPNRVYKRQLYPGVGISVDETSYVIYNCAFWTEKSNEPYDSTWLRNTTITTNMEADSVLPGLYELLMASKRGEMFEALIKPKAAFGSLGVPPRIPPDATIFCLVEVVSVVRRDKITQLASKDSGATFDDYYQAADEARMRGNFFIEQKQYNVALQRYKAGIRILEYQIFKNEDEEKRAKLLLLKLFNNSAKASIELGNPRLALAACKQATLIDDYEPKTHWYRMSAWRKKGHLDRALGVCRRAMTLFPEKKTQAAFQREADILKRAIQKEQQELNDLHRIMAKAVI